MNILYLKQDDIQNIERSVLATLERDIVCISLKYNGIPQRKKHVSKFALKLAPSHAPKKICWRSAEILLSSVQTGTSSRCEYGRHLESD